MKNEFIKKLISTTMAEYEKGNTIANNNKIDMHTNNFGGLNTTGNILIKEYEQEVQRQDTDMNGTLNATNTMGITALVEATGVGEMGKREQMNKNTNRESLKSRSNVNSPISEENTRDIENSKKQHDDFEDSSNSLNSKR